MYLTQKKDILINVNKINLICKKKSAHSFFIIWICSGIFVYLSHSDPKIWFTMKDFFSIHGLIYLCIGIICLTSNWHRRHIYESCTRLSFSLNIVGWVTTTTCIMLAHSFPLTFFLRKRMVSHIVSPAIMICASLVKINSIPNRKDEAIATLQQLSL